MATVSFSGLARRALPGLLAGLIAALTLYPCPVTAAGPSPAHPVTWGHPSPEPPLADQYVPAPLAGGATGTLCPRDPPIPVVSIHVRVPAQVAADQELEYRIVVENQSTAPAHQVTVHDRLPANAEFVRANPEPTAREPELLWRLGTLAGCASREIVLVLKPSGQGDVKNCARVQFEHGECVTTRIARPALRLRKEGPTQALLNDALKFRLSVTNTGGAAATGVRLTDSLAPGMEHPSRNNALTWEIGTLAPGQSRSVDYQVVAKTAGRLCNRAAALADGGLREAVENCVTVTEAKLSLTIAGPASLYVNTAAAYQITVTNSGTAHLQQVTLADPLPPGTTFVSASQGGRLAGNRVEWTLGPLAPGISRTVDLVLRAKMPGKVCTQATAAAERGQAVQAETCTDFIGVAALLLEVVDTDDPVEVGAETKYIISVRNQGTAPATKVRIDALAPVQMEVVRIQGASDHKKEGNKIQFQPLTLEAGKEARYVITVKAKAPGDVRFKVDLWADQLTSGKPVHEEESTTIYTDLPSSRKPAAPGNPQSHRKAPRLAPGG